MIDTAGRGDYCFGQREAQNENFGSMAERGSSMKKIELITNLVVIVVGVAVLGFFARNYFLNRELSRNLTQPKIGDQLPSLSEVNWNADGQTLLLVIRKGCHYCEESMPFYRRLIELGKQGQLSAHIVAVLPDSAEEAKGFMENQAISTDFVPGVPLEKLSVPGTPTLILADSNGRVLHVWVGELSDRTEEEVVAALERKKSASAQCVEVPCSASAVSRE